MSEWGGLDGGREGLRRGRNGERGLEVYRMEELGEEKVRMGEKLGR